MADISDTLIFTPSGDFAAAAASAATPAFWFLFRGDGLVVDERRGAAEILRAAGPDALKLHPRRIQRLGSLSGADCYSGHLDDDATIPDGMACVNVRTLFGRLNDVLFSVAGTALQVVSWERTHQYCGRCGAESRNMAGERAKICSACGLTNHPRISPAVIVAVIREGKILLGRSGRYPNQRLFSVLAGYVELGETLEECVHREVMEEAGIRIRRLHYFGSQPWPYSGSLMVAFTAAWAAGEISVDGVEILEAEWFGPRNLPQVPGWGSVAGRLIDWFRRTYG
jgi:NAD+ diphosphatase